MYNTDLKWEEASCDWCGSSQAEFIFEGPDRLHGLPGTFRMTRCRCGFYRQNPRLAWDSLQWYYPEDYKSHPLQSGEQLPFWRRLDQRYGPWKRLQAVEQYQPGGKLLEVGCGTGLFLTEALHSKHWEVTGVEPSERAASYTRQRLQVEVIQERFPGVELPENTFDVVAMWNVLEHLDTPRQSIRYVHSLLKENGWFIFSIPNLESLDARLFGSYWMGWDMPRHLYLFPQAKLRVLLEENGFRWVNARCLSTSYSALGDSLTFWIQTWKPTYSRLSKFLLGSYRFPLTRFGLVLPLWMLDRLNRSSILTIFAQKKA